MDGGFLAFGIYEEVVVGWAFELSVGLSSLGRFALEVSVLLSDGVGSKQEYGR